MPPVTPGRYQSKLFNFFHQKSRRWGEQFERTIRHLQVAANWSLEALLYPVYMLIHKATESAGKQLHTDEQQPTLQLQGNETNNPETPLSVDTPIQRVLEAAVILQVENKQTSQFKILESLPIAPPSSPLSPSSPSLRLAESQGGHAQGTLTCSSSPSSLPPIVQGIASLLANRNLVLVTAENEILDILTPQQQEKLQNRIIDEVAIYWRSWRLTQVEEQTTKLLPEIDRLLKKLTSSSKESIPALPQATETEDKLEYKILPFISQRLPLLDAAVAQMESHAVVSISRASGQLLQAVQTQLNIFIYGKQQQLTTEQEALDGNSEHQTSKIKTLIWGAIHYFFGGRNTNKLEQKTPTNSIDQSLSIGSNRRPKTTKLPQRPPSSALPKSPHLPSENIADPWLTMNDLFGNLQEVTEVVNEQQLLVTSSQSTKSSLLTGQEDNQTTRQPDKEKKRTRRIGKTTKSSLFSSDSQLITHHSPLSHSERKDDQGKIFHQQRKTTQVEAKPDWIETQAQTIGYEKHPVEQVLEWLDRVMLWLEDMFVKIGLFLQGLLRGK
ncbi:MAG: hypothetical protein KME30_05620 [Iphinoe sp. HA4291-MV1]|jgi:hypothetical protein|nr:hypothetical protein [Iphinoe sp. HA4291-MV1]